jgi:hypothetical protein
LVAGDEHAGARTLTGIADPIGDFTGAHQFGYIGSVAPGDGKRKCRAYVSRGRRHANGSIRRGDGVGHAYRRTRQAEPVGGANPMVSLRNSRPSASGRAGIHHLGRADWIDGPKTISWAGDAAAVRDLEPELQFGVFNRMHVPV